MNGLTRMKVGTKLLAGFLAVAAIGAVIGLLGMLKAGQINDMGNLMYERELLGLQAVAEAHVKLVAAGRATRSAILSTTEEERASHIRSMEKRLDSVKAELANAEKVFMTPQGKALIAQAREAFVAAENANKEGVALLRTEPMDAPRASVQHLFGVSRPLSNKAEALMVQLVERKRNNAATLSRETDVIYANARVLLIALTLGGVLAGVAIGVMLTRGLTRQIGG